MLQDQLITHWKELRGRTYDFLDVITEEDLPKTLPFPESATLFNQLWCMLGTTESFAKRIDTGEWKGWSCSITSGDATIEGFRSHLQESDKVLIAALQKHDLTQNHEALQHYFRIVEHESHHHGQIINFIFALNLPIPESWADQWALSR